MAGVRMTGLTSGLDTESLVAELSKAYQTKVDNVKKKQTRLEWKKEAWQSLNTKLMNFYKGALSTFKSTGTYSTKGVKGDLTGVKITAGSKAVSGNHKVQVTSTASAEMWTGGKINGDGSSYTATTYEAATNSGAKISDLYDSKGYSIQNALNRASFNVQAVGGNSVDVRINIDENTTVDQLLSDINTQLDGTGLTASFEKGALKFTNTTATASVDATTGETTYSGGSEIIITAKDATSASALGIAYNENGNGTVIDCLSDTVTTNSVTGSVFAYEKQTVANSDVTGTTKLTDLGIAEGTEIAVDRTTTLNSLATAMEKAGINAGYDANQGRFYLSSKSTGLDNKFTIDADADTLAKLGLGDTATKIAAADAKITYNGVDYTDSDNTFSINGLTIEASAVGAAQEFTVDTDVDGIYDKVKNFVKEYNALIKEMNELYYADSARDYDPLTSDEKDAMTEDEVEKWETKIKGSLLRRDSTISSLLTSMRTTLNKSVEVTNDDGTTSRYALSSFGIVTSTYTERGLLHIEGDADDADFSSLEDKLKAAIAENPDAVTKTLTTLGSEIYSNLQKAMKKTELSSSLTFYNDVQLDNEISDYKDKVSDLQDKLTAEEDRYYEQFSAMETALAKLQSQQTYISQLFGG